MYYVYETKTFYQMYNGIEFEIVLKFEEEDQPLEDTFDDSIHDIKELYRKIDNGTYVYFCAHMEAWYNDMHLSDDYLCGCLYKSYDDFIESNDYFSDMKNIVLEEGYKKLRTIHDDLMGLSFSDRVDVFTPSNENMIRGLNND